VKLVVLVADGEILSSIEVVVVVKGGGKGILGIVYIFTGL